MFLESFLSGTLEGAACCLFLYLILRKGIVR